MVKHKRIGTLLVFIPISNHNIHLISYYRCNNIYYSWVTLSDHVTYSKLRNITLLSIKLDILAITSPPSRI